MIDYGKLSKLAEIASKSAGESILSFYHKDVLISNKVDGSPFTKADQSSHQVLVGLLAKTRIPIVSEEAKDLYQDSTLYWLIDPLDGTKDFLAGNDEFTVNIALIENGIPIMGVLYAPALDELYVGIKGQAVWHAHHGIKIFCRLNPRSKQLKMAVSRFHDHPDTELFAEENQITERIAIGSALKYGRLALGEIDVYPRFVGTSEWDTAAGQAVLEAAGGNIIDLLTGSPIQYGKPNRRNNHFIAFRYPYLFPDFEIRLNV